MKTVSPQAAGTPAPAIQAQAAPLFLEELARLRSEIETVTDELAWVENSPLPKAEAKKRATANFAAHAGTLHLPVWQFAEPNSRGNTLREVMVVHGTTQVIRATPGSSDEGGAMSLGTVSVNLLELMLGLFGDELLAKMHRQIDALDYVAGPASEDRPAMIEKLKGDLRELGIREEELICRAEDCGTFIPRRADADPTIVLGYTADGVRQDPFDVSDPADFDSSNL